MTECVSTLSAFSIGLPFIVGILTFQNQSNKAFKWLIALVLVGCGTEIILKLPIGENIYIVNIYTIVESIMLMFVLKNATNHPILVKMIKISSVFIFGAMLINLFAVQGLTSLNTYSLLVEALYIIVISSSILISTMLIEEKSLSIEVRVLIIALLLYFGGSLFSFGLQGLNLSEPSRFKFNVWNIHSVFNIIFNFLLALSLFYGWRNARR